MPTVSSKKTKAPKRLAIANHADGDSSHGSMSGLQTVSNTSDDESEDVDYDSDSDEEDEDEDSEYDTDQEDEMREMAREAVEAALESEWYTKNAQVDPALDPLKQEDRQQGNPFLKLLGSLRGLYFLIYAFVC